MSSVCRIHTFLFHFAKEIFILLFEILFMDFFYIIVKLLFNKSIKHYRVNLHKPKKFHWWLATNFPIHYPCSKARVLHYIVQKFKAKITTSKHQKYQGVKNFTSVAHLDISVCEDTPATIRDQTLHLRDISVCELSCMPTALLHLPKCGKKTVCKPDR